MSTAQSRSGPSVAATTGDWLVQLEGHWIDAACAHLSRHPAVVRVTVIALRGSAPREAGATMLVDPLGTVGSIGGGRLEWQATLAARELLCTRDAAPVRIADFILGPDLGQCCGGRVELWLERLTRDDLPWLLEAARSGLRARDHRSRAHEPSYVVVTEFSGVVAFHRLQRSTPGAASLTLQRAASGDLSLLEPLPAPLPRLWVFGAGHVGQALIRLLSELALFDITWVDSRSELLPTDLDGCVTMLASAKPVDLVDAAPAGTRYVVLTHDHALDYELCRSILKRGDSSWLGLIGSASKSARFRSRMLRDGISSETLSTLTCPIGIPGIASKLPASIAISIAAQLLQLSSPATPKTISRQDPACGATSGSGGSCGSCGREHPAKP
jgi:xanthine dehydrogenase accessory factor